MNEEHGTENSESDYDPHVSACFFPLVATIIWIGACVLFIEIAEPYGSRLSSSEYRSAFLWVGLSGVAIFAVIFFARYRRGALVDGALGPAHRGLVQWAKTKQREEISEFINALKAMDGQELGLPVAFTAHFRNQLAAKGVDLSDPFLLVTADQGIIHDLSSKAVSLQKQGETAAAVPVMVWTHTLRAMARPELRGLGREMWGQLERGFAHAEEAARGQQLLTGQALDISGYDEFPKGLTPKPFD